MLSKKAKREIASIVNSIMVAVEMAKTKEGSDKMFWLDREREHTLRLYEQYGIELPALDVFKPIKA